ncbi:MAG TPA: PDZ domain-containing protein [Candidatus Hydrogenedentes bacterium]|nr:PDZ domain-containing protein [Candidatus Hydrogenedentota bacterium]HIJ74282.1 PDZ domain-containing protein [Candidatus Hydrogenedentota bacterium]
MGSSEGIAPGLNRDLSLGAVALGVLLLAGGIALVYKANKDNRSLDLLPSTQRRLAALPVGAAETMAAPHENRGTCHACHAVVARGVLETSKPLPKRRAGQNNRLVKGVSRPRASIDRVGVVGAAGNAEQAAFAPSPQRPGGITEQAATWGWTNDGARTGLLTPAEQNAADKVLVEGHWLGMETMDLTPALKRTYNIPVDVSGVIVDEVTLESAESGLLAGDVVTRVGGRPTRDLKEFFRATEAVRDERRAEVVVNRLGVTKRFVLEARNGTTLGFAQMEAAQPIRPGALSPHRSRGGACTDCHVIMAQGGQLPVDAGDLVPSPPPISADARAPHQYRGVCRSCHVVK